MHGGGEGRLGQAGGREASHKAKVVADDPLEGVEIQGALQARNCCHVVACNPRVTHSQGTQNMSQFHASLAGMHMSTNRTFAEKAHADVIPELCRVRCLHGGDAILLQGCVHLLVIPAKE